MGLAVNHSVGQKTELDGLVENTKCKLNGGIKGNWKKDINSNADPLLLRKKS